MEKKHIISGLIVVVLLTGIIVVTQINFLKNKVNTLEDDVSELETMVTTRDDVIESISEQINIMENTITNLEEELIQSQNNNTQLISEIQTMNATMIELQSDIQLLDSAIEIIGRDEIKPILQLYGETKAQLEDLQKEYTKLLSDYNKLLE
ncbi:hypothetical protein E4H04_10140 [Candidatus Bathyarchaeota archaeon]|nr:MAG: hypothetical protein E4H04_10140 [Candidatus Bathyarchaeota archaeon]